MVCENRGNMLLEKVMEKMVCRLKKSHETQLAKHHNLVKRDFIEKLSNRGVQKLNYRAIALGAFEKANSE